MADAREQAIRTEGSAREIGGKAAALSALATAGLRIPEWFAIAPPPTTDGNGCVPADLAREITAALARLAPTGERLAVRSSAREEDGVEHSFAGQFDTYLYVRPGEVVDRVADVWRGASSDRVAAYKKERGIAGGDDSVPGASAGLPAVLVQRMVNPDAAGVAFSADPVSGRRGVCVVSATYGVGNALVSGDVDGDTYRVARDGTILERTIATKRIAQRQGESGPVETEVAPELAAQPALDDDAIREVAALARAAERFFGRPQDIEWAMQDGRIYLLQSRPITSLATLPDPDAARRLWDNSNITESYGGVTTPLTFSFARAVYEEVYRVFCRIVGVPQARIDDNADALRAMLGLVHGRVYYNLTSWYRLLALLPGYQMNRRFMEQMMGVKEGIPDDLLPPSPPPSRGAKIRDGFALAGTVIGLVRSMRRLRRDVAAFYARLDEALALGGDLSVLRADELVAHYRELERRLLTRWDAPLVNDFFAMIFYGTLRSLATKWAGDANGTLQNDLVSGEGAIVSAEPAQRIIAMARLAARDASVTHALRAGTLAEARTAMSQDPELHTAYSSYLEKFGDRCLEELKLETSTVADEPLPLLRNIGALAQSIRDGSGVERSAARIDVRAEAESRVASALRGHPIRALLFRWVLRHARTRVRERENLRFERTRVFGRVRRIFVELGKRYAAAGALGDARDIFYLTVEEALGWPGATVASADLRGTVAVRKAEFARYREMPAPADRFETRGMVYVGHDYQPTSVAPNAAPANSESVRTGTGCYPGVVRGRVRVVRDPRGAVLSPGEILVAERTDPGWVMLFPAASGLLVERGSLLSHSAIVARELGIPAIVAVDGLTSWLQTGDEVEFDGRSGEIRLLARA